MSTLNGPICSRCSIALTYPARSHFQRTLSKENGPRVEMNLAVHQEKNKETKTGKRKAGEERIRLATNFKQAECCPSAVVHGEARRNNGGEYAGKLVPSERPTAISTHPKRGRIPHHQVKAAVDWCRCREVRIIIFGLIRKNNRRFQHPEKQ